ncbi:TPA: hypothetical protein ONA81_005834 [Pseudomonas aeruginosa]|nr:hypothetical protein [Pseudomonas aeruginosa]HBP6093974.1 hypothetical protein [Pseudomonas aeruginosa]HCR1237638.1 hypothetical protein [Pseudomonas aeruginosa]HCR1382409.1 hypothetical protein [Pseudomonas aeruginosa]HCR1589845.1 hypothetical protein [Pseudomonas aeruginosa]
MNQAIVTIQTLGGSVLFYTGRAGQDWLSETEGEAIALGEGEAERIAARCNRQYLTIGLRFVVADASRSYPNCIVRDAGSWNLYLMPNGSIRSVPTERARLAGMREAFYGDREHLRMLIEVGEFPYLDRFTDAGLEFMAGLTCGLRAGRLTFRPQ